MTPASARASEAAKVLRLLRADADREVALLGLGTVLVVAAGGVVAALTPLVLKALVDAVAAAHQAGGATGALAALPGEATYLALLLAARVLSDVRPLLGGTITVRFHGRLMRRFFAHVLRLPLGELLRLRSGELMHSLDLASAGVQLVVGQLAGGLLPVLVELATMAGVLVHLGQPGLVVVFGATALAHLALFTVGARLVTTATREVSSASLETYARLGDGIAHLETLRCFAAEPQARGRLREAGTLLERRWVGLNRLNVGIALAASTTFAASMAACLHLGERAVQRGTLSVGGFVLTTVYMLQMVRPIESLGTVARELSRARAYLRPLLDLLALPVDAACGAATHAHPQAAPPRRATTVRLENLHFAYDPRRPVLKGLSLEVPAGSTTAIVGRSGSGKSSLARLLMRLYAPQQGRILLDGRAIDSIAVEELRGTLIGLVSQDTALLHESIAANIALGLPAASRDDIRLAARGAQLDDLVDALPQGLDTPVGERGMQLSGGERQRVGIARALLRRPALYLLDEPTSMLDSRTEREILDVLRALPAGATTIVIAHRLSTIVHADEIVVLDDGQVRERGSHRALLAGDGLYARMWRQQMAGAA